MPSVVSFHADPVFLLNQFLEGKSYSRVSLLTDENTYLQCYELIKDHLPVHTAMEIPAGESYKNLDTCQGIWQRLTDLHFDRHSLLIILGGGVLGDMGGFCAATYKRGIPFVLMPTTLLAQVDASVGGKLGVDFNGLKNHIGVFCEPAATLISNAFLKTLPERELRSGFAEIIKHCLISDKQMWETITHRPLADQDWEALTRHSVAFKQSVTNQDPTEKGLRKILNFGHTIGHAVESYFLPTEERLFHGEAIAVGMIAESFIAHKKGLLTAGELTSITNYLLGIFEKQDLSFDDDEVIELIMQDKKNKENKILMALTSGIGKAVWDVEVSAGEVKESIAYYRSY